MENFRILTTYQLGKITNHRSGEVKFGEKLLTYDKRINLEENIQNTEAKFILFGIEEDFGVRANLGNPGAKKTWEAFIKTFVNLQHNRYCKANQILVLGSLNYQHLENEVYSSNDESQRKLLFKIVERIDKDVSHLTYLIHKYQKIPIIIGGGHNNAYGNIKGVALAYQKPINVVNIDAHSDFRIMEGRHSGNGFSYAFDEKFLNKYFIFGLHESYTSKNVLLNLKSLSEKIKYRTFEEMMIRESFPLKNAQIEALEFIKDTHFGFEIDMDAISWMPSSAMTPTGFSLNDVRKLVHFFGNHNNCKYLHLCEGIILQEPALQVMLCKALVYLVTDFVKSKEIE
ncbi:MAG: formimidoylglutamase [Flavobacterium sp.]